MTTPEHEHASPPGPPPAGPPSPGSSSPVRRSGATGETIRNFAPDFLQEMFANPLDAGYFDAAKRRERTGPPSPPARRFGFGLRTIALVLTGLLLTVAYHQTIAARPEQSKVQAGLVNDVRTRQTTTDELERQANTLRADVTRLRNAALNSSAAQALTNLEAQTGVGPVRGDGAIVSMADGPAPTDPVTGKALGDNLGQVLDVDLQTVTNELWHDGAEAIAINGQRITATSVIRTAGNAILVDFVPLTQPYTIAAIGPGNLDQRLRDSPTGAQYERFTSTYGMHFTITSHDNLSLPAATDVALKYAAVPAPSPSASTGIPGSPSPAAPANPSPSGGH